MAYTYFNTEPGLWTVGSEDSAGKWESESDHSTPEKAAARTHYLNGGNPAYEQLVAALKEAKKELAWAQRHIGPGQLSASNSCTALAIDAALAAAGAA